MNLRHAVLGFLIDQPMHGYQLKRALSPALPPAQMVNDGILYPLLKRMERDGLIAKRVERAGKAPDRNVYKPTKLGRDEFARWLRSTEAEQDEVSYDFMLGHPFLAKCLFFDGLTRGQVREKLDAQRESSAEKLQTFERIRQGMVERGVSAYRVAVLDLGIAQQKAKLAWIEEVSAKKRGSGARPTTRKAAVRRGESRKARKAA